MRAVLPLLLLVACDDSAGSDWSEAYAARCEFVDLDGNARLAEAALQLNGPVEGAAVTGEGRFEVYNGDCTAWQDGNEQEDCWFEMIYCVDEAGCSNGEEPFQTGQYRFGIPLGHRSPWTGPRFYVSGQNIVEEPIRADSGTCSWTDGTWVYEGPFDLTEET